MTLFGEWRRRAMMMTTFWLTQFIESVRSFRLYIVIIITNALRYSYSLSCLRFHSSPLFLNLQFTHSNNNIIDTPTPPRPNTTFSHCCNVCRMSRPRGHRMFVLLHRILSFKKVKKKKLFNSHICFCFSLSLTFSTKSIRMADGEREDNKQNEIDIITTTHSISPCVERQNNKTKTTDRWHRAMRLERRKRRRRRQKSFKIHATDHPFLLDSLFVLVNLCGAYATCRDGHTHKRPECYSTVSIPFFEILSVRIRNETEESSSLVAYGPCSCTNSSHKIRKSNAPSLTHSPSAEITETQHDARQLIIYTLRGAKIELQQLILHRRCAPL